MAQLPELAKYNLNPQIYTAFITEAVMCMNYGFKVINHYSGTEECTICLDSLSNNHIIRTPCGHIYHYDCLMPTIVQHYNFFCPNCAVDPLHAKYKDYQFQKQSNLAYPYKPIVSTPTYSQQPVNYGGSPPTTLSSHYNQNRYWENAFQNHTMPSSNTALIPYDDKQKVPSIKVSEYGTDGEYDEGGIGMYPLRNNLHDETLYDHNYAHAFM
jgi:hypothetical protein